MELIGRTPLLPLQVTFGETSTGAAMVHGSFVGQGASKAISIPRRCEQH